VKRLGKTALGTVLCLVGAVIGIRGVLIGVAGLSVTSPASAIALILGGILLGALFLVPGVRLLRSRTPRPGA